MTRSFSWGKVGVVALVVAVLAGGAAGYYLYFYNTTERSLLSGERSLKAGDALMASEPAKAADSYEAALLQASKVLDDVDRQFGGGTVKSDKQAQRLGFLAARALWLKSRALRDRAYAKAAAEGKPISEITDTTMGGTFRSVLSIPDAKDRNEAMRCLREAAVRLPNEAEIQRDALRAETMLGVVNWRLVELFSKQMLHIEEDDTRGLHQMALFHYEQAPIDAKGRQGPPLPLEKRSASRMKEARGFVEKAQKTKDAKYWRLAELEGRVTRWLRDHFAAAGKNEQRLKEDSRLKKLLGDALKKSEDAKATAGLSVYDIRALLALHQQALEEEAGLALKDEAAAKSVRTLLDRILALCERFAAKDANRQTLEDCAAAASKALAAARPSQRAPAEAWDKKVAQAVALAERARDAGATRPEMYAQLVRLLALEAGLAGKKGDTVRLKKLDALASKWLDDGLARGQKAGLSPERLGDLHILAAERKMLRGAAPEKIESHLDVLRKSSSREAQALALFLEGAGLERQGRLGRAAKKLEEAEALGGKSTRSDAALASLYLALGKPKQALDRLVRLVAAYKQLDSLTEQERAWAEQFVRSKEDVQLQLVAASLDSALRNVAEDLARAPGRPVAADRWEPLEKQARTVAGELPAGSPQARAAALALLRFRIALGQRDEAAKELARFEKGFPGDAEALQQRVALALMPEKGAKPALTLSDKKRDEADALIQAHLKASPADLGGKLFWASWLSRTGRAAKAVAYLKDPANFPEPQSDRYRQALAVALIGSGDRVAGTEVLRQLPATATIDAALIRLAATPAEREKRLGEALAKHERDGLLRCMAGAVEMEKGKYAQAADSFFKALEFTQTRRTAEQGLQQALIAHARAKPAEAREQIARMLREAPEEKALYLAYAYAALLMDDIGQPFQAWETGRTMASALRVWEGLHVRDTGDRLSGLLTRAEFWRLAGRSDLALAETERALKETPRSPQALALAAELALGSTEPATLAGAGKRIDALAEVLPDSPAVALLRARWQARERDFAAAAKTLAALVEKHPRSEDAQALRVEALLRLKDKAGAEKAVQAWRAESPDSMPARELAVRLLAQDGKLDKAEALADETFRQRLEKERKALAKRKPPEGVADDDWKKQQAQALEKFSSALKVELARPFLRARAFAAADERLKQVLAREPGHPAALLFSGESALARQDWKASRGFYERLLKAVPGNVVAANNLAWLLAEKAGEPAKARAVLEPLLKGRHSGKPLPGDRLLPEVLDTAAAVFRKLGDPASLERLRVLLAEARARYPSEPRLALHLAQAYAGLEDAKRARDMYQTAIRLAGEESLGLEKAQRDAIVKEAEAGQKKLPAGARS